MTSTHAKWVSPSSPSLNAATSDSNKYAFVLRLCAHISGCTVEQVDAQIVRVMSEQKWEDGK